MDVVIVGAGLAAASAIESLRERGHAGGITLIGAEEHLPYERPPLSKGVLLGDSPTSDAIVHHRQWYDDRDIRLVLGQPATALDLHRRKVRVGDEAVGYDALLLATGAAPRRLELLDEAADLEVAYLRTIEDSTNLLSHLPGKLLVIGAGWIGLEVAAAARDQGADVVVVEQGRLPLQRILGDELAGMFAAMHTDHGVDFRFETSVTGVERGGVQLSDGSTSRPDVVLVAIGVAPNQGLAASSGLAVGDGIRVNGWLQSSDEHVFAAGDVAHQHHPLLGGLRVEHWDNAIKQGRHVAGSILGETEPYAEQPYFFTDQYDVGMEYLGRARADDELVLRGDPATRKISAFWIRNDVVVAGMHTNTWDAMPHIRRLVGQPAGPAVRDPDVALSEL